MRLIAFAFMSFVVFSVGHAAKAQDDMTCETVKSGINSRAPINVSRSIDLQLASCQSGGERDMLVLHYVFGEINHQAADNRAGQRIGKNMEKSFCQKDSFEHKILKLMDVRSELEDLTGGKMGHHQFGVSVC